MSIKDKLRNASDSIVHFHTKENRRDLSGKISAKLGLEGAVSRAKEKSDGIKVVAKGKEESADKLAERSHLKLDRAEHKALIHSDPSIWSKSMENKTVDQLLKYYARATSPEAAKALNTVAKFRGDTNAVIAATVEE